MDAFDVVVIGAGPGGYPAAIRAAQLGARVALVEREWLGGTCLNCGCIPTKTLIAGADLMHRIRHAETLGLRVDGPVSCDYAAMNARKNEVVATLQQGISGLLKMHGVTVYTGEASFVSPTKIKVAAADGTSIWLSATKTIIATGSTAVVPGFLPKDPCVVDSRAFLELTALPKRLLVLGGGYIGCELACMAAALGVQVTLVELLDDVLMLLDKDVRQVVKASMKKDLGIDIRTGEALTDVVVNQGVVTAKAGDAVFEADLLLAAVGRRAVTDGLELHRAGLKTNEKGILPVDEYGRTAVAHIWAIGDVNGVMQLAHAATSQGTAAAEAACGHRARSREELVPGVIFTMPEVALVGLTADQAKEQGRTVDTAKFQFRGLGKGLAAAETDGFVKWIADAETGQLLGAAAVGAHATELIAEAAVAIRAELTAAEVGHTIHAHPTFSEAWMEAAHMLHQSCVHAPPVRKG